MPNCLNIDEVKRIIDGTENIKHRCMIKMLYGSGLRLSELINLEIADIDSARMLIRIVKSKGNKDRVVTLPESILTDLRTCYILHKPDVYLFEGQWGGQLQPDQGFEVRVWREGELLIFDDTIEHEARNDSDELRVVLLFDVWNPLLAPAERDVVRAMATAARGVGA